MSVSCCFEVMACLACVAPFLKQSVSLFLHRVASNMLPSHTLCGASNYYHAFSVRSIETTANSVAALKQAIASKCDIPEEKQVLLISGGESLNANSRVCSYGAAGTDTS